MNNEVSDYLLIPKGWRFLRNKYLFEERKDTNEHLSYGEGSLLSVSEYYGVALRKDKIASDAILNRADSLEKYRVCKAGDLVMNIMLAWKGSMGVSGYEGIVSPAYSVYIPKEGLFPKYFHYLFRTNLFTSMFRRRSTGIIESRLRLYPEDFFSLTSIVPPFETQQRIASFLDKKSGQIDRLISLEESQIEKLLQYKQTVIFEAVTKGLDPDVEMKNSGIGWIGLIPQHWTVCKQKYQLDLINGRAYSDDEFETNGKYRILRVGNLFSNPEWYSSSLELPPEKYCSDGDLLYAWSMSYGPHIWHGEKVIYHYHIWKVEIGENLSKGFAYYYLVALTNHIKSEIHVTTMSFLTMANMNNSPIVFPPLREQKQIEDYLHKKIAKIDQLVAIKQKKIRLLGEYKESLIYESVTGKKEVA